MSTPQPVCRRAVGGEFALRRQRDGYRACSILGEAVLQLLVIIGKSKAFVWVCLVGKAVVKGWRPKLVRQAIDWREKSIADVLLRGVRLGIIELARNNPSILVVNPYGDILTSAFAAEIRPKKQNPLVLATRRETLLVERDNAFIALLKRRHHHAGSTDELVELEREWNFDILAPVFLLHGDKKLDNRLTRRTHINLARSGKLLGRVLRGYRRGAFEMTIDIHNPQRPLDPNCKRVLLERIQISPVVRRCGHTSRKFGKHLGI